MFHRQVWWIQTVNRSLPKYALKRRPVTQMWTSESRTRLHGREGRFRVELPRSDVDGGDLVKGRSLPLVAAADGYGLGWTAMPKDKASTDLTIRLVKDELIRGRVLTTEGKPVANARISVITVSDFGADGVKGFLDVWKSGELNRQQAIDDRPNATPVPLNKVFKPSITDKDGRFQIHGAGAQRFVMLGLSSPSIGEEMLLVITQPGLDLAPYNKEAAPAASANAGTGRPTLLMGLIYRYRHPGRAPLKAFVREAGTNKPIPGITVSSSGLWAPAFRRLQTRRAAIVCAV